MPSLSQDINSAGSAPTGSPPSPPSNNPTPGQAGVIQTNQQPVPAQGGGLRPQPSQVQANQGIEPRGLAQPHQTPQAIADPQHPQTPSQAPSGPVDWAKATAQLEKVIAFYEGYAGKVGCNPYFYLHEKVRPLENSLLEKERLFTYPNGVSKAQWEFQLYTAIMALECKESYAMHDPQAHAQEQERQKGVLAAKQQGRKEILFN
jgi:hypothetical protein